MKKQLIIVAIILVLAYLFLGEKGSGPDVSQNGIAPIGLAEEILTKYDRNKDKELSVSAESFLRDTSDKVVKVESRGLLFTHADSLGDANGMVSKDELGEFLQNFDTDKDGEITTYTNIINSIFGGKSEWGKFIGKYDERFKYDEL